MIEFKNGKDKISIPSSWDDLSFRQVLKIIKTKDEKEIVEIISGFPFEQSKKFIPYFDFLRNPVDLEAIEPAIYFPFQESFFKIPEIRSCCYGQKILFQNKINEAKESEEFYSFFCELLAIYFQPLTDEKKFDPERLTFWTKEFEKESFVKIYSVGKNLINQFAELIEFENKLLKTPTTPEQMKAGVKMFDALGEFNTIDILAGGDVLKYEAVLEIEYNTILNKLYKMKLNAKFETNLREILKNN